MNLITNILNSIGWYPTIFILMLLESTVIPVPSEFVVTPAAYYAAGGWHSVLALLGWYLYAIVPEEQLNDKISEYAEYIKIIILGLLIIAAIYFGIKAWRKRKGTKHA